jgi:hypothetical protein
LLTLKLPWSHPKQLKLGIAQIALATNQEGAAGGIDAAISWGVGTFELFVKSVFVIRMKCIKYQTVAHKNNTDKHCFFCTYRSSQSFRR